MTRGRRLPVGAEITPDGVSFRVWAPARRRVELLIEGAPAPIPLLPDGDGHHTCLATQATAGSRYRFRLDGGDAFPDPASRFQPEGPHGPSEVVDPAFPWTDDEWRGPAEGGQVIYELHVGTCTGEGTFRAAHTWLPWLRELGVTVIELMPVAEFDGRFGWGYDGVDLFAPTRLYGRPAELRAFVDDAHRHGLGVILDVVYNHLGPSGNYMRQYAPQFFTDRYENEWGEAIDFDGPASAPVRAFFRANVRHWIEEYHFDGLRLDATQSIHDASPRHIICELAEEARRAGAGRRTLLVAENEPQRVELLRPREAGGSGLDAMCNDDFHHAARVALTGRREAYYTDYRGTPQELVSAVKRGFLFQGQRYRWQGKRRGTPTRGIEPHRFVVYLQSHDQVANSLRGERLHRLAAPAPVRAITALLLLAPQSPMLFQGQEFQASAPFLYFADHEPALARLVQEGRASFVMQFPSVRAAGAAALPAPHDPATFARCKLDLAEAASKQEAVALHRDLLRLRRDPIFRGGTVDGAVLGERALCLRWSGQQGERLLLLNLGADLPLDPAPEPLLAPPEGRRWQLVWSSEDVRYGGGGQEEPKPDEGWSLPAAVAIVLGDAEEVTA